MGWGVKDGVTGNELGKPGPNSVGHYALITWGCGAPCLMAAVVDLQSGAADYPPITGYGVGKSRSSFPLRFSA